jgi:hypothetical protein
MEVEVVRKNNGSRSSKTKTMVAYIGAKFKDKRKVKDVCVYVFYSDLFMLGMCVLWRDLFGLVLGLCMEKKVHTSYCGNN